MPPQKYRDARGRYRKPTDEERWPNPSERERIIRIRGYFDLCKIAALDAMKQSVADLAFLDGKVWGEMR